jgi:YesN/AraC family two-component response regulator
MSLFIKRITGFSAKQCINKYLITYAQQKLRSPKVSISQVSHELGFVDVNTFGKFFKSQLSISPREYITKHGKS